MLNHIKHCIDRKKYSISFDLDNKQTNVSTIPPNIIVTNLIPDIVIIDEERKKLEIFELTCPAETRIDAAHELKIDKYAHFVTDIKNYATQVTAFEIGAHTGLITKENNVRISNLYKYCKKGIKKKTFVQNLSSIALLSSYHLFNNRNEAEWHETNPVLGPFKY